MRHLLSIILLLAAVRGAGASGILTPTDTTLPPLRITDHLVDTSIKDGIALTTVTQTFRNETDRRLEATYVFPIPEEGDLTDFRMTFNGKMVQGRVLPADEAVRIYEQIVRQSKDPGVIEFIGRRLLQMRVFPIEPQSETTIQVGYQQVCRPISGMMGYHYPLRTRCTAGQAYGTVRFSVSLESGAPLKGIWSPTHAVEIVRDGENNAKVAYEASGGSLEDDFILLYGTDSRDLGLSAVSFKPDPDNPGHFVLMMTPKQLWPDEDRQPQDVVFVIDTSGSMAGDKLAQAQSALRYCVEQLDEDDRMSVVRFSTGFDALFDEPVSATKDNRAKATAFIEKFRAAGGTNIGDTLDFVAKMPRDDDRPFVVVFLTDGQGNRTPDAILSMLEESGAAGVRVFPFGVGHDVNTLLLDRLSETYSGRTTFVQPGENLELVLGDFFSVISRPVLTGLRLTLPGIDPMERFPATLGDLYHGQQLIVAGQFDTEAKGPVKLTAKRGGKIVEYSWPSVSFEHEATAEYVPSVWAGRKIAYLVDQIRRHGEKDELIAELVALSQLYGIQTPYTAWLVDPERQQQVVRHERFRNTLERAPGRPAPGSGLGSTFGGGGGGAMGRRGGAVRALEDAGVDDAATAVPAGARGVDFDLGGEIVTLAEAEDGVLEESGRVANLIARANTRLREARGRDDGRLSGEVLPMVQIDARWFHRIGSYIVDSRLEGELEWTTVKFGSDAWFELARTREDLRRPLAAGRSVAVLLAEGQALLVSESDGIETFSEEDRKHLGLDGG